jgi:hypothetical protein
MSYPALQGGGVGQLLSTHKDGIPSTKNMKNIGTNTNEEKNLNIRCIH